MEGGEEGLTPPPSLKDRWVAEWLDKLCPYYMAIGVPYDEFWYGDYTQLKYYVEAYDLNRQRKSDEMWLMGLYVHNAVSVVMSNAFSDKGKKAKYIEEPIRVIPYTPEEKAAIAERERQKTVNQFAAMLKSWEQKQGR